MENNRRQQKKMFKRTMWFIGIFGAFALIISALLIVFTNVPQWLNMMVIVLLAGAFYLVFLLVCAKIDKKKEEKEKDQPKKPDPFSD